MFALILGLVFLLYWLLAFFLLYHLIRFGVGTKPKQLALIFFIGSVILFFISTIFMMQINTDPLMDGLRNLI